MAIKGVQLMREIKSLNKMNYSERKRIIAKKPYLAPFCSNFPEEKKRIEKIMAEHLLNKRAR